MCVYTLIHLHTSLLCVGSYVHVMDSAPYIPHSQPMDSQMPSDPMSPPPEGEGLKASLVRQLEYYFSKENLSSDKYLCKNTYNVHGCVYLLYLQVHVYKYVCLYNTNSYGSPTNLVV